MAVYAFLRSPVPLMMMNGTGLRAIEFCPLPARGSA
jgi:hypothetical protein